MEELWKLESVELTESRQFVSKLHERLKTTREPALLGELVEFYFKNGSKRARKVLTSLREAHSQDYFDKLYESIQKTSTRLPVLKLLAHTLNSQTSWLYRIVDHPLFTAILEQLKASNDIVVLCSALFVVTAILPLVPSYIGPHLDELFGIFCTLAAIRDTNRLGLTPKELCLHLDVAVYYFFLQLYALFPNALFMYLKDHCSRPPLADKFSENIAPLFYQVQLHPSLITGGGSYELSKSKWGAMEPDDIATLSLQLCLDKNITAPEHSSSGTLLTSKEDCLPGLITLTSEEGPTTPLVLSVHPDPQSTSSNRSTSSVTLGAPDRPSDFMSTAPYNTTVLSDLPEPSGLKSSEELGQFWSPLSALGSVTPHHSSNISPNESNHSSVNFLTQPQPSNISSPLSDSAVSSTLPTPRATNSASLFTFKNYSPTASIDSESLHSRAMVTQSAVHTPMEETSHQLDPLSQSMRAESTGSPVRAVRSKRMGSRPLHNQSFKQRVGRLFGMFVTRTAKADDSMANEDFTEIFASDIDQPQSHSQFDRSNPSPIAGPMSESGGIPVENEEEIGEECLPDSVKDTTGPIASTQENTLSELTASSSSQGQDVEPASVSNLSSRPSRSTSESSEDNDHSDGRSETSALRSEPRRYSDMRRDSHNPRLERDGDLPQPCSFSYPERGPSEGAHKRARNSNSEASTTHTMLMVQERLKEFVESSSQYHVPLPAGGHVATSTPIIRTESGSLPADATLSFKRDCELCAESELQEMSESTATCTPPGNFHSGPMTLSLNLNTSPTKDPPPAPVASSLPTSGTTLANNANNLGVGLASRLFIKRVSVCSRKTGNHFSESSVDSTASEALPSVPSTHSSPVGLLDQYVSQGVMLHKGRFETIPLTELEGVDWNHFGGCPHSEEFGMMQAQVVLLHSQLLFERYQCMQHARRNRTLLSQARSATKVAEELQTLRDQLYHQSRAAQSLHRELQRRVYAHSNSLKFQENLQARNRSLTSENKNLKDNNLKLSEEVRVLREQALGLETKLQHSNDKVASLEIDRVQLQSRLEQAETLKDEVELLSHELQVLGDLYQQQKEDSLALLGQGEKESDSMCAVLGREKEAAERKSKILRQELGVASARVKELEHDMTRREKELESLQERLQAVQGKHQEKIKALEDKYQSMKVIGLHLENHILELKGKPLLVKKKRHKRSSSHPTGSHTPSPHSHTHSPLTHPSSSQLPPQTH